jgi:hypothetical protein
MDFSHKVEVADRFALVGLSHQLLQVDRQMVLAEADLFVVEAEMYVVANKLLSDGPAIR